MRAWGTLRQPLGLSDTKCLECTRVLVPKGHQWAIGIESAWLQGPPVDNKCRERSTFLGSKGHKWAKNLSIYVRENLSKSGSGASLGNKYRECLTLRDTTGQQVPRVPIFLGSLGHKWARNAKSAQHSLAPRGISRQEVPRVPNILGFQRAQVELLSHHDLRLPPGRWAVWWGLCGRGILPFGTKKEPSICTSWWVERFGHSRHLLPLLIGCHVSRGTWFYKKNKKMHKRSLKGNLQRSERSLKATRFYKDEVIKLKTLKTRRMVRDSL
ncbi:hypothetical protein M9H77_04672 [Catharanthus roseus]|uniref:Uncharacterized protein n=1 Tax=Catharanthus roseus TaxID=4058 RepID=A0ACC0CF83_CATRO|nr:hypothetical protein M9H77_04672 [Catharanthus roseus]